MCVAVFIPNCRSSTPAVLAEVGCAGLFDRVAAPMFTDQLSGPGGQHGKLIFTEHGGRPLARYDAATQEWLDCGAYWLGVWRDGQPTPELLAREPLIDGYGVTLCDGQTWTVPICDYFPKRLTIDRLTGEETTAPPPEHADYIGRCHELFLWFLSDDFQERLELEKIVHIPQGLAFAATALAKNYRINRDFVDLLALIDEHTAFTIARVATGLALVDVVEAQKKTGGLAGATN